MSQENQPLAARPEELRETARKLAEGVSSRVSDSSRGAIGDGARHVMDGLRAFVGDDAPAAAAAVCFVKLLSMLAASPVSDISDILEHTCAGYAMAAGALMGAYALPESVTVEGEFRASQENVTPEPELPFEFPGQYL